jgi:hypothetical protein
MLLSPQLRKYPDGYATCSACYTGMQPKMASKKTPPEFAIANGFVIGSFPQEIKFFVCVCFWPPVMNGLL